MFAPHNKNLTMSEDLRKRYEKNKRYKVARTGNKRKNKKPPQVMQGKKESSHQHECCLSWSSEDESLTANTELTTFD